MTRTQYKAKERLPAIQVGPPDKAWDEAVTRAATKSGMRRNGLPDRAAWAKSVLTRELYAIGELTDGCDTDKN